MAKFLLSDIKDGQLVTKSRLVTVKFMTADDIEAKVDVQLKQLPYAETDKLHKRLGEQDETVVAEWIAKSIVKDDGKPEFTAKQVNELFSRELVMAIMDEIMMVDQVKKFNKKRLESLQEKTNSSMN